MQFTIGTTLLFSTKLIDILTFNAKIINIIKYDHYDCKSIPPTL